MEFYHHFQYEDRSAEFGAKVVESLRSKEKCGVS